MFGYLKPDLPYLYIKDDTLYKAVYCGLCKSIGRECGQRARLALTYDVAFFSALVHNLAGEDVKIKSERCVAHWIKRRPVAQKDDLGDFSAYLNAVLAYYKLKDDVADENKGGLKLIFLTKAKKRADKKYPELSEIVSKRYGELFALEDKKCDSPDMVAEPFAKMLEELSSVALKDKSSAASKKLFYYVGKWIYLVDALDDYDKDVKKGNYNPLYYAFGQVKTVTEVVKNHGSDLNFVFSELFSGLKDGLNGCKFYFNHDLIDNVITRGIPSATVKILKKGTNAK